MRLRVPAASLGLCYPGRGIERFVQRLGLSAAQRILVAAETLDADEMLRLGFLDHLLMPAEFSAALGRYAEQLAALAPLSVRAMKAISLQCAARRLDAGAAATLARACEQSADLAEGFAAMREKRPPVFRGR
jgi:enoyl-CoA hydratase/carnithine racemase